jgi:hypothetical protein
MVLTKASTLYPLFAEHMLTDLSRTDEGDCRGQAWQEG